MRRNDDTGHRGPSQRQLRVGELIRRTLSEVLARGEVHDPELGAHSITVGEVRVSPDLKQATAFVMPLGGERREEALLALRRNAPELRHHVSRGLTLKYAPRIRFEIDETFDAMDATRRLLSSDAVRRDLEEDRDEGDADDGPGRDGPG